MRRKRIILLLLLIVSLSVFGILRRENHLPSKQPTTGPPDVEELQALPYAQWTKISGKARKAGVTTFDKQRAWHGYNLYTNDVDVAFLMDMTGTILHSWEFPRKKNCEYVYLLPTGEILAVCVGQGIIKVDWNSNPVWISRFFSHHDIEPLSDGTFWTIRREMNREYKGRRVVFDMLQRIDADGQPLEGWHTFEHLDELQRLHKPMSLDTPPTEKSEKRYDYYHLNTVKILPENPYGRSDKRFQQGNILICLRNADLIAILDKDTFRVVWDYGTNDVDWPHMPVMLPTGNILIFDNGFHRKWSRVIEVNPTTKKIVWSYGDQKKGFYSPLQGSSQRLPNGNTLICASGNGHVFEVDPSGKIVWDFWNPEIKQGNRKTIYRFIRIPVDSVPAGLLKH